MSLLKDVILRNQIQETKGRGHQGNRGGNKKGRNQAEWNREAINDPVEYNRSLQKKREHIEAPSNVFFVGDTTDDSRSLTHETDNQ